MISIVVVTYNRPNSLKLCIESLLNQSYKDYEIIIIDDGSTKYTQQLIKTIQRKHKTIRYFKQGNKGRGAARNLGIRKAKGNVICFTDDDCTVPKNWLENIEGLFKNHPNTSAVGGAILNGDKNPFDEVAYVLNFSSWFSTGKKRYVNDIPTANVAYKKADIKGINFPVEHGDLDYEDSFFNYSLIKKRKNILFDPSIKVYHNARINNYKNFLKNQQRKAASFIQRGYKIHGLKGNLLIKFKFLNLFCPRLLLIFLRCLKSPKYLSNFILYFPLVFRGELERGLTIFKHKA